MKTSCSSFCYSAVVKIHSQASSVWQRILCLVDWQRRPVNNSDGIHVRNILKFPFLRMSQLCNNNCRLLIRKSKNMSLFIGSRYWVYINRKVGPIITAFM